MQDGIIHGIDHLEAISVWICVVSRVTFNLRCFCFSVFKISTLAVNTFLKDKWLWRRKLRHIMSDQEKVCGHEKATCCPDISTYYRHFRKTRHGLFQFQDLRLPIIFKWFRHVAKGDFIEIIKIQRRKCSWRTKQNSFYKWRKQPCGGGDGKSR